MIIRRSTTDTLRTINVMNMYFLTSNFCNQCYKIIDTDNLFRTDIIGTMKV